MTDAIAARLLFEHWAMQGTLRALPGERDRNFHVYTADRREFTLKISPAEDDPATLDLQDAAIAHVARQPKAPPVPRPVRAVDGRTVVDATLDGDTHALRLLTWLPGEPLALVSPHTPDLLQQAGAALGGLTHALSTFTHPAARRSLKWDLAQASWILEHIARIDDEHRRVLVSRVMAAYEGGGLEALRGTRTGVVHNDANDYNILVDFSEPDAPSVSGLIDFGDVLHTHVAGDVAIAMAYAMLGKPDPLSAGCALVAGYHGAFPLTEGEIAMLLPLVRTRLAVSVVNSTVQAAMDPGNEYLQVSAAGAWSLLEQLDAVPDALAECRFRDACGLVPSRNGAAVARWLESQRGDFAPLMPSLPGEAHVHDFSVTSLTIGTIDTWRDQRRFTGSVEDELARSGKATGIGRYDEVRAIYTTDLFRVTGNDGPEWRTVHIGVDVGAPAGTPICAPLAGVVHSVRDNTAPGDYGPTIILEHPATAGRPAFWTLYGHLSRDSIATRSPGDRVAAGEPLGTLGDLTVNGGWWPHVHVQVMADLLGRSGDFPGVARPAEREVMLSLCPDPSPLLGVNARAPRPASLEALSSRRARSIGPSLSVSYHRPLHIVRGVMQHLVDANGRRYLDAVNNVAHVGHAHPDVVRAGQSQMEALNTNTRYLHEAILEYAERLVSTLPDPLSVCYFVNSGSEANELALRMARAWSGEQDVIVVDVGYHGNTTSMVDVSPYKFNGPGGTGAPSWVRVVPMPDTYRGPFRDEQAGLKYAQAVRDAMGSIRQAGRRPAAFLAESILSCGGQVPPPPGYLAEAYRHVRAAGGLCIADEVQVGLGRVGRHWWGFEAQGVVPDIVTMGKPLGNGHPLGAVVTTPDVAARFANGMEYFNTFGGNPVSCRIGLAVLDVMVRDGLRENAQATGAYLVQRLRDLADRHLPIGDVRGEGLFVGVELVSDRDERTPDGATASYVANRMRDRGVLMSTDGPFHNVLKVKPPLCFSERDADQLVETMDTVLSETPVSR